MQCRDRLNCLFLTQVALVGSASGGLLHACCSNLCSSLLWDCYSSCTILAYSQLLSSYRDVGCSWEVGQLVSLVCGLVWHLEKPTVAKVAHTRLSHALCDSQNRRVVLARPCMAGSCALVNSMTRPHRTRNCIVTTTQSLLTSSTRNKVYHGRMTSKGSFACP